jgi:drug/metabolite transporter (DMT)-like permease
MAYLLATMAAAVNALTSVLQRIGVETAPATSTLRLSLMTHALRRGIWLIGFALMLVVFGLQASALRFGDLSVVQPVLTTEILFLLLILAVWFHYRLRWLDWLGAATIVGGLATFFLAANPRGGHALPSGRVWLLTYVILLGAIAVCIFAALRGPRWWRAAAFGAATAVTAAFSAALTKAITTYVTEGWGHVFDHAQPYLLAVTGIGTVFLIQNALHAGPITASRTTMVTINPMVSIVLGITLFGDRLRSGPGWISLEVVGLAVLVVGVVVLARSPLVAGTGDAADTAGAPGHDEMLGGARNRAALAAVEAVAAMDPGTID